MKLRGQSMRTVNARAINSVFPRREDARCLAALESLSGYVVAAPNLAVVAAQTGALGNGMRHGSSDWLRNGLLALAVTLFTLGADTGVARSLAQPVRIVAAHAALRANGSN